MGSDEPEGLAEGENMELDAEQLFDGFVIVELADPDDLAAPVQLVPASERLLLGPAESVGGKIVAEQGARVPLQPALKVRHEVPDPDPRVARYAPVVPGVLFHVKP